LYFCPVFNVSYLSLEILVNLLCHYLQLEALNKTEKYVKNFGDMTITNRSMNSEELLTFLKERYGIETKQKLVTYFYCECDVKDIRESYSKYKLSKAILSIEVVQQMNDE